MAACCCSPPFAPTCRRSASAPSFHHHLLLLLRLPSFFFFLLLVFFFVVLLVVVAASRWHCHSVDSVVDGAGGGIGVGDDSRSDVGVRRQWNSLVTAVFVVIVNLSLHARSLKSCQRPCDQSWTTANSSTATPTT